jgi:hypothetical protein
MGEERKQTYGEELSDMFYALQITTKIMEAITKEHDDGKRDQQDFELRWNSQCDLLCRNLAKIKSLTEKFITAGYSKYASSVGTDTKNDDVSSSDRLHDTA